MLKGPELKEWGSVGAGASTPVVPRPEHFRTDRKEPGSMLPEGCPALLMRHALFRTTRISVVLC
jgi:hypothetical protein